MSRFHNALYTGDVAGRIAILREAGMGESQSSSSTLAARLLICLAAPLAYLTAKTNGLTDVAAQILQSAGLTEDDVEDLPASGHALKPPPVVTPTASLNWPSTSTGENFFDRALASGALDVNETLANGDAADAALDDWAKDEEEADEEDAEEAGGWGLEDEQEAAVDVEEEVPEITEEAMLGAAATPGMPESERWTHNSPFAADHVAAGAFESAMQVRYLLVHGKDQLLTTEPAPQSTTGCR
jgi:coatomer protein complex subunit alpha (xenin)